MTFLLLLALWAGPAASAEPASAPDTVRVTARTPGAELEVARAIFELAMGNPAAAREHLEECLEMLGPPEIHARAAYLLTRLERDRGCAAAVLDLAAQVDGDPFGAWIRYHVLEARLGRGVSPKSLVAGASWDRVLAAQILLEEGRGAEATALLADLPEEPLVVYLRAVAAEREGRDARHLWESLLRRAPGNALEAEIAGVAALRATALALAAGQDPMPYLDLLPGASHRVAEGMLIRGLHGLERGDTTVAPALEAAHAAASPAIRREAGMARAAMAMDLGDFERAADLYTAADREWIETRDRLDAFRTGTDPLWALWENTSSPECWLVAPFDESVLAKALARGLDLRASALPAEPYFQLTGTTEALPVPLPTSEERLAVTRARDASASAWADVAEAERALDLARKELARRRRYLQVGGDHLGREREALDPVAAQVDSLLQRRDAILARITEVKDRALARFARRSSELSRAADVHRVWIEALGDHFTPGPGSETLRTSEDTLTAGIERWSETFAARVPALVEASHDRWRLDLESRAARLQGLVAAHTGDMDALAFALGNADRQALVAARLDELDALAQDARLLAQSRDAALRRTRHEVALASLSRARRALEAEREGIDYGLAAAAYELERDDAPARLSHFLSTYPESPARGEARFRLAEVLLARGEEGAVPLYRAILAEDVHYPHRDAVLMNLGMTLRETGDPQGIAWLERLVADFPASAFRPEATLRLADARVEVQDLAGAAALYEDATRGPEPGITATALFKLGWCLYNVDRFSESADAFHRLLDLHDSGAAALLKADIHEEVEKTLVEALVHAGGADAFARLAERWGPRERHALLLLALGKELQNATHYDEAVEADALFLARYPDHAGALEAARRQVASRDSANRPDDALAAGLAAAPSFLPDGAWGRAQGDSLRLAGEQFAYDAYRRAAVHRHERAQDGAAGEWPRALAYYDTLLTHWPAHADAPRLQFQSGEAAVESGHYARGAAHFEAAARSDTASFAADAAWRRLAAFDAWYRAGANGGLGTAALADSVRAAAAWFADRHPGDPRSNDALWRRVNLSFAHGHPQTPEDCAVFLSRAPGDPRRPQAAALRADALYRNTAYEAASAAYETALHEAREAKSDSLAARVAPLIPLSHFRHAEGVAAAQGPAAAASLFEDTASRWPDFEHAGLALYRAGLGHEEGGHLSDAIRAWSRLVASYPEHELVRDALVLEAGARERSGDPARAARTYQDLSERFPDAEAAGEALLKAGDLLDAAGDSVQADTLRLTYLARYPDDIETGMAILEAQAEKDLRQVDGPISSWLRRPTRLARYLKHAAAHPDLASPRILARVQLAHGEEIQSAFTALPLKQPLATSLAAKKTLLDSTLAAYGACAAYEVPEVSRAAAFRIGEALIALGEALEASERPADLTGDDLAAYQGVLDEQAWTLYDRGEAVWSTLLREAPDTEDDPGGWLARARERLWPRLARRFLLRPEAEIPLAAATAPEESTP